MIERFYPFTSVQDQEQIPLKDIYTTFAASPYGTVLDHNPRWGKFIPVGMSLSQWERHLGLDVNNLDHLYLSHLLTQQFLQGCREPYVGWNRPVSEVAQFNAREEHVISLAAVVHDWAEAIVGDIPEPIKTVGQDKEEMFLLHRIVTSFCENSHFCSVRDEMREAVDEVLIHKDTKLAKAFKAIEVAGYVRTACNAWRKSKKTESELAVQLINLAAEAIPRQIPKLIKFAEVYPPIHQFINHQANAAAINEVLTLFDSRK